MLGIMKSAILGHTGFVGSNLVRQHSFSDLFNSKNSQEILTEEYDMVVCAAAYAVKWAANKDPEGDARHIDALMDLVGKIRARKFILISTIDVYPAPNDVDEDTDVKSLANHAYGAHRSALEGSVEATFPDHHIIRLPGLFGTGLKKNAIFDLLNNNGVEKINPASSFQFYDLERIWPDISNVIDKRIKLINFATEPIAMNEIASRFFPDILIGKNAGDPARYDVHTKYSSAFGKEGPYLYARESVLKDLGRFISSVQKRS
jgi:nucleoside-diphosphate-sugar epimerase